jgi:hypothetical protein
MTEFNISSNDIRAEGGKTLAEGLKGNQVIKELNFSGNNMGYNFHGQSGTPGIIAIADVIPGIRAISSVFMNKFPLPVQDIKSKAELGLSGKELNYLDAIIIAALLPLNVSRSILGCPYYR